MGKIPSYKDAKCCGTCKHQRYHDYENNDYCNLHKMPIMEYCICDNYVKE